jgi:hypothetical protein
MFFKKPKYGTISAPPDQSRRVGCVHCKAPVRGGVGGHSPPYGKSGARLLPSGRASIDTFGREDPVWAGLRRASVLARRKDVVPGPPPARGEPAPGLTGGTTYEENSPGGFAFRAIGSDLV